MKKKIGITLAVVVLLVCVISVAALAGCKEKVTAENAQAATEANWAEIDNKSATTTVKINNAEIALGVNGDSKAVSITASAEVTLNRTWKDGVLTIDVTAKPTAVKLHVDAMGLTEASIMGLIDDYVNFDKLSGLKFEAQAFYNYGSEEKTIGVRNMTVSGLASAIPAVVEGNPTANITDKPYAIKFLNSDSGQYDKSEVSFDLASIDLSGAQSILNSVFGEGYNLDLVGIIEGLLVNQTMLDFSDATNAAYADGQYQNNVKVTDNLKFISEIWNQINDEGKAMVGSMLEGAGIVYDDNGTPENKLDDKKIMIGEVLKNILGVNTLSNVLPDLLAKVEGTMSVSGAVEDGIFTSLNATLSGTRISLTAANVDYIIENVVNKVLPVIGNIPTMVTDLIKEVAGGSAYISLGTITVNSTFTA